MEKPHPQVIKTAREKKRIQILQWSDNSIVLHKANNFKIVIIKSIISTNIFVGKWGH